MKPRIDVEVGVAAHGGADPRELAPEAVQLATTRFEEVVRAVSIIDDVAVEAARLRNAYLQQCFH